MKARLTPLFAILAFLYYYIGAVSMASYALVLKGLFGNFKLIKLLFIILFFSFIYAQFLQNGILDAVIVLRYFWGFTLFYFAFSSTPNFKLENALIPLSLLTLAEALLVNTILDPMSLPNYPTEQNIIHFGEKLEGGYQRPYSFGASASVTSVTLTALMALSPAPAKTRILPIMAIISCNSGSGYLALAIYFIYRLNILVTLAILLPSFVILVLSNIVPKISFSYMASLVLFKLAQIETYLTPADFLIGSPLTSGKPFGGDFAIFSFFNFNGIIGLVLLFSIAVSNINKRNILPIIIMLSGSAEYGTIFFFPGQIVFGYILATKIKRDT